MSGSPGVWIECLGAPCQTAAMKTKRAGRAKGSRKSTRLGSIPGGSKVGQVDIPTEAFEKRLGNHHYRESTEPLQVFKTLLVTLWYEVGRIERATILPSACSARALTDALRAWAPTYDGDCLLRKIWRSFMGLLTPFQRKLWRAKFAAQLDSWKDWKTASRLAGRVHSVWFRCLVDETGRR